MPQNTIDYSTRDFLTIQSQINSDDTLKQSPSWIKNLIAGVFDVLNNTLNAVVNSILIRTAYSRPVMMDVLKLIDYDLSWKQSASSLMTVNIDPSLTAFSSYTIVKADLKFQAPGTTSRAVQQFEALSDLTFPMGTSTTSAQVSQQATQISTKIGVTDGSNWQLVDLPQVDVLRDSVMIQIGSDPFTRVDSFVNYTVSDKVFKLYYRSDGSSYVIFGGVDSKTNYQFGFIATPGQDIILSYATGGGQDGNVTTGQINQYIGSDTGIISVINNTAATGGAEAETIANARQLAPLRSRETGYFINESTGISLSRRIDGVMSATIKSNGLLSVNVWIIPNGGGYPSTDLKNEVQALLQSRSVLGEITVSVFDPIYIDSMISIAISLINGFSIALVSKYVGLAVILKAHEMANSVIATFEEQGISAAIDQINSLYSSIIGTFSTDTDSAQITDILTRTIPIGIGETLQLEDIITAAGLIKGVDYPKVLSPIAPIVSIPGGQVRVTSISVTQL